MHGWKIRHGDFFSWPGLYVSRWSWLILAMSLWWLGINGFLLQPLYNWKMKLYLLRYKLRYTSSETSGHFLQFGLNCFHYFVSFLSYSHLKNYFFKRKETICTFGKFYALKMDITNDNNQILTTIWAQTVENDLKNLDSRSGLRIWK